MARVRLAAAVILAVAAAGCSVDRLAFTPTEEITPASADRLRLVYCRAFDRQEPFIWLRPWRITNAIGPVAVNGNEDALYLRRVRNIRRPESPAGLDVYDLRSGDRLRRRSIPENQDMTGAAKVSWGDAWIDAREGVVYVEMPGLWLRTARVDMKRGEAALIEGNRPVKPSAHPLVDKDRMMLVEGDILRAWAIVMVNRRTGKVLSRYGLPGYRGGLYNGLKIVGAGKDVVVAVRESDERGYEILTLQPEGRNMRVKKAVTLGPSWRLAPGVRSLTNISVDGRQLVVAVLREYAREARLRIYDLPSLELRREIPLESEPLEMGRIGRVLFVNEASHSWTRLNMYDTNTGEKLGYLSLANCFNNDWNGSWWVFADPHRKYVGVYGTHWVQLFAVKPK